MEKESDIMWALKGLAIISVVCAHCNIIATNEIVAHFVRIMTNLGSIGVGIFFWVSGFYFNPEKKTIKNIIGVWVKKYLLPWLLAATAVWLYVVLRKGGLSLPNWINYILGNGSIYYFLTDLLAIQVIGYLLLKMNVQLKYICWGALLLTEVFILLEANGISSFPTPYLDFLCFIGYFVLGNFCRTNRSKMWALVEKIKSWPAIILASMLLIVMTGPFSYFADAFTMPFELLFIAASFLFCVKCSFLNAFFVWLGKNSFFIFLWHIPIAGIISNIGNRSIVTQLLCLLWPVAILAVMVVVISVVKHSVRGFGLKNIGIRALGLRLEQE